jgi:hypothetical protein
MAAELTDWQRDLHVHLQAAVELELLVIPPYLCALYSLHPGKNEEASLIIRSVVVEEMLHMVLAANVLNAVGGTPVIAGGDWVPRYPTQIPFHQGPFEVGLRPFGDEALDTFLAIENPSYKLGARQQPTPNAMNARLMTLGGDGDKKGYKTIGAFYHAIRNKLEDLVREHGEDRVFCGDRRRQVGPEHYYGGGGHAIEVDCLKAALDALEEIAEQGEGELTRPLKNEKFDQSRDLAHFYRFNELRQRRRYLASDTPEKPTGAAIDLDLAAVYPMKPNLRVADLPAGELRQAADACNAIWTTLLGQIETAFTGSPGELRRAGGTMFQLKYAACDLLRIPLPGDVAGRHAGPTFEVVAAKD